MSAILTRRLMRSVLLAVVAFLIAAGATYRCVAIDRTRAGGSPSVTATAYVVERSAGAAESRIPFSYSDTDARWAQQAVNTLAEQYAEDRRIEWKRRSDKAKLLSDAARKSAHKQLERDEARLDACRRQLAETKARRPSAPQPATTTVDNPQWLELNRTMEKLIQQREKLLVDRTPLHPTVQDVVAQMEDVKQQMDGVPRKLASSQSKPQTQAEAAESPIAHQREQRLAELSAAVEASRRKCEELDSRKTTAAATPEYAVMHDTVATENLSAELERATGWTPFLAGTMMAFGVGLVSIGGSIRPVAGSIGQVRADTGVPVIGDIPALSPVPNPRKRYERQCALRRNLVGFGLVLVVSCPLAVFWAITAL